MAYDERVEEGVSRGKPVYYVAFNTGEYEITFDKKTLAWKKAWYFGSGSSLEGDYYGLRECKLFREDHPGVFEYAAEFLSSKIGRKVPVPRMVYRTPKIKIVVKKNTKKTKTKGRK